MTNGGDNGKGAPSSLPQIRADLHDEYRQSHTYPWIVGYSGGKDSTLVAHLVIEMLMSIPPSDRTRHIHIVANDTLVESPPVVAHMTATLDTIRHTSETFALPIATHITRPESAQSFWVNLIGRGYPSPNSSFRWCTDRLKIRPTSAYIKSQVSASGQTILLLGVRRAESSVRASSVARHDAKTGGGRLHPHGDLPGCMVYRPIVDLGTAEVWEFLALNDPPWGGSHLSLIGLYRQADGGNECPVVTSAEDAPACGTSARFGCWTCTLVHRDRSLAGFVEAGHEEHAPLLEMRDWLVDIRNEPARRQIRRRDGSVTFMASGRHIPGPYTLATRMEIMDRLRDLETKINRSLISDEEVEMIHHIWTEDIDKQNRPTKIRDIGKANNAA